MSSEIIIVSGLPRSGTSLMMQMLENGGVEVVTDRVRAADTDNPRGYYEFEPVKKIRQDASWLPGARGKAFKMVSQLLYHLPPSERYRVIFMARDLEEMLVSQEKLLERLQRPAAPREKMRESYTLHLENLHDWLRRQGNIKVLRVSYNDLMERPEREAERLGEFLGRKMSVEDMAKTVDRSLYRNKKIRAAADVTTSAE
jgi:Sulfotransferase domain